MPEPGCPSLSLKLTTHQECVTDVIILSIRKTFSYPMQVAQKKAKASQELMKAD
jgi:hypothetical protein